MHSIRKFISSSEFSEDRYLVYDNKRVSFVVYGSLLVSLLLSAFAYQVGLFGSVTVPLREIIFVYFLSLFTDPFFLIVVFCGGIYRIIKKGFRFEAVESIKETTHWLASGILLLGIVIVFIYAIIKKDILNIWLLVLIPGIATLSAVFFTPYIFRLKEHHVTNVQTFDTNIFGLSLIFSIVTFVVVLILQFIF